MADSDILDNSKSLFKGSFDSKVTYRQSLFLPTDCMSFSQTGFVRLLTSVDKVRMTTDHGRILLNQQFEIKKGA